MGRKRPASLAAKNNLDIEEAEVVEYGSIEKTPRPETKHKEPAIEFPGDVMEKVQKAKRNIYVQRAWDRRTDNKIKKICREEGEATAKEVLSILYKNLNGNIKTTLVQYINGILKNISADESSSNKQNLTLFNNIVKEKGLKSKKKLIKLEEVLKNLL